MEAVISGQAGVALLVDGDALSSIHVHDLETAIARRPGEYHYLFGASSDLVFIEDVSADEVRLELRAAADGEDVIQLTLLLLAADRPDDIRRTAGEELAEILAANPQAAGVAERLLLSATLPDDADMAGAQRWCEVATARDFLVRLERLQPFVGLVRDAWRAIPENHFGESTEDCRAAADSVFVREGVVRQFVLAAAGEPSFGDIVCRELGIPAVRSMKKHRSIVTQWKLGLAPDQASSTRGDVNDMLADDAQPEGEGTRRPGKTKSRRGLDRKK